MRLKLNDVIAVMVAACAVAGGSGYAAEGTNEIPPGSSVPVPDGKSAGQFPWDLAALKVAPKMEPAEELAQQAKEEGLQAIYYDGLAYKGKPTRVFAWYGAPKNVEPGKKVPAIVLVHGGGGTAFASWVKLWNGRGYAAIAMDNCGGIPVHVDPADSKKGWKRHEGSGPNGWGGFDQVGEPKENQWSYHAVADVVLANSLIRSFPEVDAERVGITGISWGGYLTCIVAGVDDRFKFAVPVYGCGFLGEDSAWVTKLTSMGKEKAERWLTMWDPSQYLPYAKMPMLWVDGTNDFAFPPESLQKSYRLPQGERTLCMKVRMAHGHGGPGENPEEILAFAESVVNHGTPLVKIGAQGNDATASSHGFAAWVEYSGGVSLSGAELAYTKDTGKWQNRRWETMPARVEAEHHRVTVAVPERVRAYYFLLKDERGLVVTSEHVER